MDIKTFLKRIPTEDEDYCQDALVRISRDFQVGEETRVTSWSQEDGFPFGSEISVKVVQQEIRTDLGSYTLLLQDTAWGHYYFLRYDTTRVSGQYWGRIIWLRREKLKLFYFEDKHYDVTFVESIKEAPGVICDVYEFYRDAKKDLGIIRIEPGCQTPLQLVLKGERTVEGYFSGKGKLVVTRKDGTTETHEVSDETTLRGYSIEVGIGDKMQWQADPEISLIVSEVCFPPYEEGRFENIG